MTVSAEPRTIATAASPAGPVIDRLSAMAILVAAVIAVVFLARVHPDPRGFGTHEQLGMQPCSWPVVMGLPCPTCGVTTAACHVVHLQLWSAVRTQPFGAALALFGLGLAIRAAWSLLTGTSFLDWLARWRYGRWVSLAIVLALASWLYTWSIFVP